MTDVSDQALTDDHMLLARLHEIAIQIEETGRCVLLDNDLGDVRDVAIRFERDILAGRPVGEPAGMHGYALANGVGWVAFNPDTGEEYSPNHPVESGECVEATGVRRSTLQEDALWAGMQEHFQRSLTATPAPDSPAIPDDAVLCAARNIMRVNRDYEPGQELPADEQPSPYEMAMARAALTGTPTPASHTAPDALREAARDVIDQASDHYTARNGRTMSIEGDDGEKCWIVPFDAFEALRAALATSAPSDRGDVERLRDATAMALAIIQSRLPERTSAILVLEHALAATASNKDTTNG